VTASLGQDVYIVDPFQIVPNVFNPLVAEDMDLRRDYERIGKNKIRRCRINAGVKVGKLDSNSISYQMS
jgi:hypothetical protein